MSPFRLIKSGIILFTIIFIPFHLVFGINSGSDSLRTDSHIIEIRNLDSTCINEFYLDDSFDYLFKDETKINLWDQIWFWIWQNFLGYIFSESTIPVIKVIFYIIIVLIIIFFILRILKVDISGLFYKKKSYNQAIDAEIINASIEPDLDQQISNCVEKKSYREAIRLLFIKTIKVMNAKKIISWSRNKTNFDYMNELRSENLRDRFRFISLLFEYTWYGEFRISKEQFDQMYKTFHKFYEEFKL